MEGVSLYSPDHSKKNLPTLWRDVKKLNEYRYCYELCTFLEQNSWKSMLKIAKTKTSTRNVYDFSQKTWKYWTEIIIPSLSELLENDIIVIICEYTGYNCDMKYEYAKLLSRINTEIFIS